MTVLGYYLKEYKTQRDYKLCMALPCHINDIPLLEKYCLPSIERLEPKPDLVLISINDGHDQGLKGIRIELFDKAFKEYGIDVLFSYGVDSYFRKHLLKHARRDMIVGVPWAPLRPFSLITINIINLLRGRGWSGAYFLPKKVWYEYGRKSFEGYDSDVHAIVNPGMKRGTQAHYKWIRIPQIFQVRLNRSAYINRVKFGWKGKQYTQSQKILRLLQVFDF